MINKRALYLAGGFYKEYKDYAIKALSGQFDLFDPEQAPQAHAIPGCYVGRDLRAIDHTEILLAYQDSYPYVYGMAAEMGYAVALQKTVIYVCTAPRVDSFLSGLARATFTDLESACKFLNERYPPRVG